MRKKRVRERDKERETGKLQLGEIAITQFNGNGFDWENTHGEVGTAEVGVKVEMEVL